MPRSAMRRSNLATGQLADCPVSQRLASPFSSCSSWGEGVALTRQRMTLAGSPAPWPFVSDGLVVAWSTCTVEEKEIIACVSVDR